MLPGSHKENLEKENLEIVNCFLPLYEEMQELCDCCFFLCDALDGMLSTEVALEQETIRGIRLTTDGIKQRARAMTRKLRILCEETG